MKNLHRSASLLALCAGMLAGVTAAQAQELKIGDPAPKLEVMKWIKGEPAPTFKKGTVYVVEFWATWCGPCKASIPHLTELAKQHKGSAVIIGVNVRETEHTDGSLAIVEKFVQEKGDEMDYVVAMDDPKNPKVFPAWMTAAGQRGIPTSFVVDQKGIVVWIGHPQEGLDEAIAQTINGTIDLEASRAKQKEMTEMTQKMMRSRAITQPIMEALQNKEYQKVIDLVDQAVTKDPALQGELEYFKLQAMLFMDETKGLAYIKSMVSDPSKMALAAYLITGEDGLSKEAYEFALQCAQTIADKASDDDKKNQWPLLAKAHFRCGNIAKAIELQEKAIQEFEKGDSPHKENFLAYLKEELAAYKAAKQ